MLAWGLICHSGWTLVSNHISNNKELDAGLKFIYPQNISLPSDYISFYMYSKCYKIFLIVTFFNDWNCSSTLTFRKYQHYKVSHLLSSAMLSSWSYFVFLLLFTCWWESVKSVTSVALSIVLTQWEWTEFTGSQKHVNAAQTIQPSLCCWHCISHITFAQSMHMITFPFRHLIFCVFFSSPSTCTCFFTCIFLLLTQKQFN